MPNTDLPHWLDKIELSSVAVLTLDDGECVTADILEFNDDRDELLVDVVASNRSYPGNRRRRSIPVRQVVSFEALSRAEQPWLYSDPCKGRVFSIPRFVLLTTLFLAMVVGGPVLFILSEKRPYGFQEVSAIVYTLFVAFFTFAATRGLRPYAFTCPAVKEQAPRLLWRHLGFLVALFALQTTALAVRPNLPGWWNTGQGRRGETPFEIALFLLCFGIAEAQVFTNRSLLDRAHREFSPSGLGN